MKSSPTAALAVVLGILACGCPSRQDGPRPRPAPLVVVAKVEARDVSVEVRAPVELRPIAQADVGAKTLGYLDAVLVDRGDRVRRGQLVAVVRPSDLPDQLVSARGSLSQAEAGLALAKKNRDRAQALSPSGIVSQAEVQQAQTGVAQAEAQVEAAKAQVGVYATRLGEAQITSPLDGVVTVRRLDPGALVGPASLTGPIIAVARIDVLRVFVGVNERQVELVKVGQKAHVEVDALPGRSVEGLVVRLSPTLDPATRTLDAEVQLDNKAGVLMPGMFGHAGIVTDVHPRAPIVPATAIQISNGKRTVFVLVGDRVERRAVETGVDEGTWLEVKTGVKAGDEVVTTGADTVSDGTQVRATRGIDPFNGKPLVGGGELK